MGGGGCSSSLCGPEALCLSLLLPARSLPGILHLPIPASPNPPSPNTQRDAAIVRLLRQVPGMPLEHPFLLDLIQPQPGSLVASQARGGAGMWVEW